MQSNWAVELFLVSIALTAAALAIAAIVLFERRSKRSALTRFAEDAAAVLHPTPFETLMEFALIKQARAAYAEAFSW